MNEFQRRVRERLDFFKYDQFELAERLGLHRNFIFEIFNKNKKTIHSKNLLALSKAFDCDPEYLLGKQQTPRKPEAFAAESIKLAIRMGGEINVGVWRTVSKFQLAEQFYPAAPDLNYPSNEQRAYKVVGNDAKIVNLENDDVAITVSPGAAGPLDHGDTVVTRRSRNNGAEYEIGAGVIELVGDQVTVALCGPTALDAPIAIPSDDVEILGVILSVISNRRRPSRA